MLESQGLNKDRLSCRDPPASTGGAQSPPAASPPAAKRGRRAGRRAPGAIPSMVVADGHTASNTPDLFRLPKLSGAGPGEYWGGGPPGNSSGCCWLLRSSAPSPSCERAVRKHCLRACRAFRKGRCASCNFDAGGKKSPRIQSVSLVWSVLPV